MQEITREYMRGQRGPQESVIAHRARKAEMRRQQIEEQTKTGIPAMNYDFYFTGYNEGDRRNAPPVVEAHAIVAHAVAVPPQQQQQPPVPVIPV